MPLEYDLIAPAQAWSTVGCADLFIQPIESVLHAFERSRIVPRATRKLCAVLHWSKNDQCSTARLAKGARCAPLLDTSGCGAVQALSLVRTIRTCGRSITTWGASELPQDPMVRVETSLSPLEPPSTNGHFIAPWTPRPTVRRLDAMSLLPLNSTHCHAGG
jgi:hypothetical protein